MNPRLSGGSMGPKCQCGHHLSRVVNTRPKERTNSVYRRRECVMCLNRFTTMETHIHDKPPVPDLMGSMDRVDLVEVD